MTRLVDRPARVIFGTCAVGVVIVAMVVGSCQTLLGILAPQRVGGFHRGFNNAADVPTYPPSR